MNTTRRRKTECRRQNGFLRAAALFGGAASAMVLLVAQQPDIGGTITRGDKPAIAVTDFRGTGEAQALMEGSSGFNATLWDELSGSGALKMVAKSFYPLEVPQQPADFRPVNPNLKVQPSGNGHLLTDWSGPPVNTNYLAYGYSAVQDGRLVLFGWLYNAGAPDLQRAQLIGKLYYGSLDAAGAKAVAREFAADILKLMGVESLSGTRIFFVSDRTGNKEIWSMDYDGSNQKQMTSYRSISQMPAVSADGKMFAFTTYARGNPQIMIHSTEGSRRLTFYNPPVSSVVGTPEFTPDNKHLLFTTKFEENGYAQLAISDVDGGNLRRLSNVRAIEVSPRVNPRTGNEVLFISGRSGRQQLWMMDINGSSPERLTSGEGDVANPSWSPDGQRVAFCWTRGYEPGNFNIFIMEVASKKFIQLTQGIGRNENPYWAPDGIHLVFTSKRGASTQVYTMLADGTNVKQLTTQGNNIQPVWAKGAN
jgi:TolB protein